MFYKIKLRELKGELAFDVDEFESFQKQTRSFILRDVDVVKRAVEFLRAHAMHTKCLTKCFQPQDNIYFLNRRDYLKFAQMRNLFPEIHFVGGEVVAYIRPLTFRNWFRYFKSKRKLNRMDWEFCHLLIKARLASHGYNQTVGYFLSFDKNKPVFKDY